MKEIYTNFHTYARTWIRKLIKKLKILDINNTLFDNVAFVFVHVMETFSKDFLGVRGFRSRGFQLLLHELQQLCVRNFGKKCNYICWITQKNSRRIKMWSICCLDLTARNQCAEDKIQRCITEYSFITYAVLKSYNQQTENNIFTLTEDSSQTA